MPKIAESKGTETIVTAPQYKRSIYKNHYDEASALYKQLILTAKAAYLNLNKHALKLWKEKKLRGISGTNYMLIEFSLDNISKDALDLI